MDPSNVYPGYANMPSNISKSEVLANQESGQIAKTGSENIHPEIKSWMEQWNSILKTNGFSLPTDVIEEAAIMNHYLSQNANESIQSTFVSLILGVCSAATAGQIQTSTILKRMEDHIDTFQIELERLEELNNQLKDNMPRTVIKAKKPKRSHQIEVVDMVSEKDDISVKSLDSSSKIDKIQKDKKKDKGKEKMEDIKPYIDYSNIDPISDEAKQLRQRFQEHYAYDKFTILSLAKQKELLTYYAGQILQVRCDEKISALCDLVLADLIDKEGLIQRIDMVHEGKMNNVILHDACEDISEAINKCGYAYGSIESKVVEENGFYTLWVFKKGI